MELSIKKGRRNLQEIYSLITDAYSNSTLVEKAKNKTNLLTFITNLHMQDSKETSGLNRI